MKLQGKLLPVDKDFIKIGHFVRILQKMNYAAYETSEKEDFKLQVFVRGPSGLRTLYQVNHF